MKLIGEVLIFVSLGILLVRGIDVNLIPPSGLKDYFVEQAVTETGAINLVSSIYLNYRAFDTLGETIVLLLAVSGIIMLFETKR